MALAASRRGLAATLVVLALAALLALHPAGPVRGASITVNTTADELNTDGDCSLREAIQAANTNAVVDTCTAGNAGADTITLPAGTYSIAIAPDGTPDDNQDGDFDVTEDLTIQGDGAAVTFVEGCAGSCIGLDRVFHVQAATVTINDLTIRKGNTASVAAGLFNDGGVVTLNGVTVANNEAALNGGGLYNLGRMTLNNSTVASNVSGADGGGILNGGILTLAGSTVSSNTAVNGGGVRTGNTLTINSSTISDNTVTTNGGGVYNDGGTLTVQGSQVLRNTADDGAGNGRGGGLYNASAATATVEAGVVAENTANVEGGGLWNDGALTVRGTAVRENAAGAGGGLYNGAGGTADVTEAAVRDNTAESDGGGVRNAGTLTLERSLLAGNTATGGFGGGLSNQPGGTATLRNSTVSGNRAPDAASAGGGIHNDSGGTVRAAFVTVAGNSAAGVGGGVMNGGTFEAKGLLLADNTAGTGPDCRGTLASQGSNLIEDTTDCTVTGTTTGNLTGVDPALGPLGANGGPTETHALLSGSPALDAVAAGQCTDLAGNAVGVDQRGVSRPQDGNGDAAATCDIGAFELARYTLAVTLAGGGSGTVASDDGGIACPPGCSAAVLEGSTVTLTAAAGAGSVFAGWAGGCTGTAASVLVTVVAPVTCTATFEPAGIRLPETGSGGDAARR